MEFYYYCEECGWNEETDQPETVFLVDKNMSDPHPETLFCDICNKEVSIKKVYNPYTCAAIVVPMQNFKYEGKFKKFYERKREDTFRRKSTGLTVPELVKSADIAWTEKKTDPRTGQQYDAKVYPKDAVVPTHQWEQIPLEKRKIASKFGIYPQKDYTN